MENGEPPAKPRLAFGRGKGSNATPAPKRVPIEDALARMAGKMGERRRASDLSKEGDADDGVRA